MRWSKLEQTLQPVLMESLSYPHKRLIHGSQDVTLK